MSGVNQFIYVPARHCGIRNTMSMVDEAADKDVDFNKITTEIKERSESHYTETRNDLIVKTLEEYHNDSRIYETLKRLLDTTKTANNDFGLINLDEKEESISSLKKQIKNCKNPMQLKELNQKLNEAYKKRKKKR